MTPSQRPEGPGPTPRRQRLKERLLLLAGLVWVGGLLLALALFAFVGEGAWPVVLLLYLPRPLLLLPGLALLPFALRRERPALRWSLAGGGLLWLFPVAGFVLPWPVRTPIGPTLRVLSYNTTQGVDGAGGLRALVLETHPDLVLLQWTSHLAHEAMSGPEFSGWTVRREGKYTIGSRFPVRSFVAVGDPNGYGPPLAHALVETPLGLLDVLDIRPQSARMEVGALRHRSLRQMLRELRDNVRSGRAAEHIRFREGQQRTIAEEAKRAGHLLLIAGDSNLPQGSLLLRQLFGGYTDGFDQAGWGFGWTYPARVPWLRLDRALLGPGLRATSFEVLSRHNSGHRAVLFEIARAPPD